MQIYPLTIPKSSLGACVKNLPWPPRYIQDELCFKTISCDLIPYRSILWTVCLPNSDQQQEQKVFKARGSHLVMALTSSQVKGNSDAPSFHLHWAIPALLLDSSRTTVKRGDKAVILWSCCLDSQGLLCSTSPICSWLSKQGVRAQVPPGAAAPGWDSSMETSPAELSAWEQCAETQLSWGRLEGVQPTHSGICQPHRDAPGHFTHLWRFVYRQIQTWVSVQYESVDI